MVLDKENDARFSHRVAEFVKHVAVNERHWRKPKNQIFRGEFRANHNGRRELLMLFVGR